MTIGRLPLFMGALLFLVMTSCGVTRTQRIGLPESSRAARSVVAAIRDQVEAEFQQHLGVNHAAVVTTLARLSPRKIPSDKKRAREHRRWLPTGKYVPNRGLGQTG